MIVLTQNIWGGAPSWKRRRGLLARRLAALRPDVVGLQEVHAPDTGGTAGQAHELCGLLDGYEVTFAPGRVAATGRCEGVAILSRHPMRGRSVVELSGDRSDRLDRFGPRVVLHALVDLPEGPVDVFVTHLSISRRARARTILEALDFADRERSRSASRGSILMGDLNAEPDEPIIAGLEAGGWLDTWKAANAPGTRGGTWPAIAPIRRLDYILVGPSASWRVLGSDREPISGSDHRGVVARLDLIPAIASS